MQTPFSPIQQTKVSDDIVDQIKTLIRQGLLKPGDKLPSERNLAQMLQVGRSSLREAINSLAMMGLVEVRQRKGMYVRSVGRSLVTDPLRQLVDDDKETIAKLYDIRIDIEVAAAEAAALNRTDAQLAEIFKRLDTMGGSGAAPHDRIRYRIEDDLQFHTTVADAADNFLRVHIIKEIFDLAGPSIASVLAIIVADQHNIDTIHSQHVAIADAIERRQKTAAGEAMHSHLAWVKGQLACYL